MGDEFEIRRKVGLLKNLLKALEQEKLQKRTTPKEINTGIPTPKPQAPGNIDAISTGYEIQRELHRWAITLNQEQTPPPHQPIPLCDWVYTHAYYIAHNPDSESFEETLDQWIRDCEKITGRGQSILEFMERGQSGASICHRLHQSGITNVTTTHLSTWAARGNITYQQSTRGRLYKFSEVIAWINRDK